MLSKKESIYRPTLKKAWQITWQNKYLWLFGFFATFLGSGSVYDVVIKGWQTLGEKVLYKSLLNFTAPPFVIFEDTGSALVNKLGAVGIIAGSVLGIVLIFIIYIVALIAQGSLIYSSGKIAKHRKASIKEAIERTLARIYHIFVINIGAKILIFLMLFSIGLPIYYLVGKSILWSNILYFVAFLIAIPVSLIILFIMIYSVAGIMTKNLLFTEAIKDSLEILKKHWLISLEMALILLGISILLGILTTVFLVIVSIPMLILAIALFFLVGEIGLTIVMLITLLFFLFSVIMAGSFFTSFQLTSWTILYLKLSEKNVLSAVIRILKNLPKEISKKLKK